LLAARAPVYDSVAREADGRRLHAADETRTPMERLRRIVRSALRRVDDLYRLRHGLQPVGPVLFVGRARYHGLARHFADGTQLRPGDVLGTLHFNNARIAALDAATPNAIASRFSTPAAGVAAKPR
jgi:hypothetical protein